MVLNYQVAWLAIFVGVLSGTLIGVFFYDPQWLGGYGSWRRRMIRLGHIAFLGTGLLNLGFAVTVEGLKISPAPQVASLLLVAGVVTMPGVCFLSAWRDGFRFWFFVPVVCLVGAAGEMAYRGLFA